MGKKRTRKTGGKRKPVYEDTVYFPLAPNFERGSVAEDSIRFDAKFTVPIPAETKIPEKLKQTFAIPGIIIPTSVFKPLMESLKERGQINPKNFQDTTNKLSAILQTLTPHMLEPNDPDISKLISQGYHLTPITAAQNPDLGSCCSERAALMVAMARGLGYKAEIRGHPDFNRLAGLPLPRGHHVWPVIMNPETGEGRHFHIMPALNPGTAAEEASIAHWGLRILQTMASDHIYTYREHTPKQKVEIPRLHRPDVFGKNVDLNKLVERYQTEIIGSTTP